MNNVVETSRKSGRVWAYIGAILGGTISIAANVAHSFVPPVGAAADWSPKLGAVIGSMFWPILLFVAVEILARVAWPNGWGYVMLRFGGLIPVAAVAGLVSYRHLSALLLHYGEDNLVSVLGPLAVDGLMVMATVALLVTANTIATTTTNEAAPVEPTAPHLVTPTLTAMRVAKATVNAWNKPNTDEAELFETVSTASDGHSPVRPARTHRDLSPAIVTAQTTNRLVNGARAAVANHHNRYHSAMTAEQLAVVMNVTPDVARDLLVALDGIDEHAPVLNGHVKAGV